MNTPQENTIALINVVKNQLGLTDIAESDWTQNQRIQYNTAIANYIKANPDKFTTTQVNTANTAQYQELADFTLGDAVDTFGTEILNQAQNELSLGGNILKYSIYIAVAIIAIGWVLPYALRKVK